MAPTSKTAKQFQTLQIVYWTMAGSQVLVGVVVYWMTSHGYVEKPDYELAIVFQKVALFFVPASMAAGYFIFRSQLGNIDMNQSVDVKLKRYLILILIRGALIEIPFFFCCVAALVTGVEIFLYIAPIMLLVFLLLRPTPESTTSDLQLSPIDASSLIQ